MRFAPALALAIAGGFAAAAQDLAVLDANVYVSPEVPLQPHTTIRIHAGKIVAVGTQITVPSGIQILHCKSCLSSLASGTPTSTSWGHNGTEPRIYLPLI